MSIIVRDLTKIYDTQKAVSDLSFNVSKGEILGFLGPNGAGKSTTMKIITGFIQPSEGMVKVCDMDVSKHSVEIKKKIGYLPENNPLYSDLYIKEYLTYIGELYHVKNLKGRVNEMIELTGLTKEMHKKIYQLSKGYKQRIGLAQAMIHDPEVLIMDEPTSGLDPNQLQEIRQVIKHIGKNKAVIFSTHIMQEVEALCDRVIIINQGKLVHEGDINDLKTLNNQENIVTIEFKQEWTSAMEKNFLKLSNDFKIIVINKNTIQAISTNKDDIREKLFDLAVQNQLKILEMHQISSNMEDVFSMLTTQN